MISLHKIRNIHVYPQQIITPIVQQYRQAPSIHKTVFCRFSYILAAGFIKLFSTIPTDLALLYAVHADTHIGGYTVIGGVSCIIANFERALA